MKIRFYNPPDLIIQNIPIEEKVRNIEVNQTRNGFIVDVLTSVDIQELLKLGEKTIQNYAGIIYRENFEISPFRKVIEKLCALRHIYKNEGNDLLRGLVKLIMNNLYGVQIR